MKPDKETLEPNPEEEASEDLRALQRPRATRQAPEAEQDHPGCTQADVGLTLALLFGGCLAKRPPAAWGSAAQLESMWELWPLQKRVEEADGHEDPRERCKAEAPCRPFLLL